MKDIGTLIYIGIILISIFGGLLGKKKKKPAASFNQPQQKPKPVTSQKTLEDIIRELTTGTSQPQPTPYTAPVPVSSERITDEYASLEDEDPEDVLVMDEAADHHVHGRGFDDAPGDMYARVEERFEVDDWRKAIIVSEILKRPDY